MLRCASVRLTTGFYHAPRTIPDMRRATARRQPRRFTAGQRVTPPPVEPATLPDVTGIPRVFAVTFHAYRASECRITAAAPRITPRRARRFLRQIFHRHSALRATLIAS